MSKSEWSVTDISNAKPIGSGLSIIEFQTDDDEFHNFHILECDDRIVFGGCCNMGFLESGYILKEDGESLDDTLMNLLEDLYCFYNDGPEYVSRIIHNERM